MVIRLLAFTILLGFALVLIIRPRTAFDLTGLQPLGEPSIEALDQLAKFDDHTAKPFFDSRNQLEVAVPRVMTAQEFLELYLIDQPHIRTAIAQEEGWQAFQPSAPLKPGKIYSFDLTPPESDP